MRRFVLPESPASVAEYELNAALVSLQRRLRMATIAFALMLGATAGALTAIVLSVANVGVIFGRTAPIVVFLAVSMSAGAFWWRRYTLVQTAAVVERRALQLENLLVTAAEVLTGSSRPLRPLLREELYGEALNRLRHVSPTLIQPLGRLLAIAVATVLGSAALIVGLPWRGSPPVEQSQMMIDALTRPLEPGDLRVVVTPPAYLDRQPSASINPATVTAIEGSRVRLETAREAGRVFVTEGDSAPLPFEIAADHWRHEFTATESRALLVSYSDEAQRHAQRLVHVSVQADARPLVVIRTPAKDLMFNEPQGEVVVEAEARDDIALDSFALRFTRMSGSGETFAFEEGELPLQIDRSAADAWKGRGTIRLQALKLADGDTLVYRAVARDKKPAADPAASESFTIEIGRLSGASFTGFALPEDRERQGLSQQMLILKTERLHADREKLGHDRVTEQSRLLAIEQRMVRAEFVFMTGGEVEDEVEEATHAHELAEGRLENQGQAELLAAIREMSRAEARLNAAETAEALVFERLALRALQRAFDRRRYLLRTLPERTRIDPARRLSGGLEDARSAAMSAAHVEEDPLIGRARRALIAASRIEGAGAVTNAELAAEILRVDPTSQDLQTVALQVSSARDDSQRSAALRSAQRVLREIVTRRLAPASRIALPRDPLEGRVADQLSVTRKPR
jgi:hypothetical protein